MYRNWNESKYISIINTNWNINLPKDMKEIYSFDNEQSFLGDGVRYHVFELNSNATIIDLNWNNTFLDVKSSVNNIIGSLSIPIEYYPDFTQEYKYYYVLEKDSSELYILFNDKSNRIYIIEDIR